MRLFYGIPLSREANDALRKELNALGKSRTKMKLVEPGNLHVTLLFVGEKESADKCAKALEEVPRGGFDVTINRFGAFPDESYVRVFWAGISPEEKVINIHRVICSQLGLEESGYKPHITLARLKAKPDDVVREALSRELRIPLAIDRVQLLESELTPKGPKYRVVHEVRL